MKNKANKLFIYFALCALITPKITLSRPAIISPELYARGAALYARGVEIYSRGPQTFTNVCQEMVNRKDSVFLAGIALTAGALMLRYHRAECKRAKENSERHEHKMASFTQQLETQATKINLLNSKLTDIENKVTYISNNQIPKLEDHITKESQQLQQAINQNHAIGLTEIGKLFTQFECFQQKMGGISGQLNTLEKGMETMGGKLDTIGQDTRKVARFVEQFQPQRKSISYLQQANYTSMHATSGSDID